MPLVLERFDPMYSYTITIGRNVNNEPMSNEAWEGFKRSTTYALEDSIGRRAQFESFYGVGSWEGTEEESYKITALGQHTASQADLGLLRDRLAQLALDFGQDAIALTIGQSELVTPSRVAYVHTGFEVGAL